MTFIFILIILSLTVFHFICLYNALIHGVFAQLLKNQYRSTKRHVNTMCQGSPQKLKHQDLLSIYVNICVYVCVYHYSLSISISSIYHYIYLSKQICVSVFIYYMCMCYIDIKK